MRLSRVEDAETGYNAMIAAYSSDLRPKPEGLKKILFHSDANQPLLSTLKPNRFLMMR